MPEARGLAHHRVVLHHDAPADPCAGIDDDVRPEQQIVRKVDVLAKDEARRAMGIGNETGFQQAPS